MHALRRRMAGAALSIVFCSTPALAESARSHPVTGVIHGGDGRPLAAARVELFAQPDLDGQMKLAMEGRALPEPLAAATTDPQGKFTLQAPSDRLVWIAAASPQHARARITLPMVVSGPRALEPFVLPQGRSLSGRILDPRGRPMPGVAVFGNIFQWDDLMQRVDRSSLPVATVSSQDGAFTLDNLPLEKVPLAVRAEGYAPQPGAVEGDHPSVVLRLKRAATLEGRVVKDDGVTPAAGAWVVGIQKSGLDDVDRAGSDGRFRLSALSDGVVRLHAMMTDAATKLAPSPVQEIAVPRAPPGGSIILKLRPGAALRARVVSSVGRAPVAGAFVRLAGRDLQGITVLTSPRGEAALAVAAGAASLMVKADRFLTKYPVRAQVTRGQERALDIALDPAAMLEGTIRDIAGVPLPGARLAVGLLESASWAAFSGAETSTGADATGTYRFRALPSGIPFFLRVEQSGFAPFEVPVAPLFHVGPPRRLDLKLERGLTIEGRLIDTQGSAVAGASIVAIAGPPNPRIEMMLASRHEARAQSGPGDTTLPAYTSDAQGRFRVAGAKAGAWSLDVRAPGFAPKRFVGLEVAGASPYDAGDLVLERGFTIRGRVVGPDGAPVEDWSGRVVRDDVHVTLLDPRKPGGGAFESPGLAAGAPVRVHVSAEGYRGYRSDLMTPPVDDLVVTLSRGARLKGRVVDDGGLPVTEFRVEVMPGGGGYQGFAEISEAFQSDDGSFALDRLEPGPARIKAFAQGYKPRVKDIEVKEDGEDEDLVLTLSRAVTISGMVVDENGDAVAGARVAPRRGSTSFLDLSDIGSEADRLAQSDEGGLFLLTVPDPGRIALVITHADHLAEEVEVDASRPVTGLTITMSSGGQIAGTVVRALDGSPVAEATIRASSESHESREARSGQDGSFLLKGLRSGSYTVQAFAQGAGAATLHNQQVGDKGPTLCELRLRPAGRLVGTAVADGLDLASVTIQAMSQGGYRAETMADGQGRFEFTGVPAGSLMVMGLFPRGRTASVEITIPDGEETVEVTLALPSGSTIEGTVTRGGAPVDSAELRFMNLGQQSTVTAETDGAGRYVARDVPDGEQQVMVTHPDHGILHTSALLVQGDRRFDVVLQNLRIRGRVAAAGGQPLEATINAQRVGATGVESVVSSFSAARSDGSGAYTLDGLGPAAYDVTARSPGYAEATRRVVLKEGDAEADFSLEPADPFLLRIMDAATRVPLHEAVALVTGADQPGRIAFMGQIRAGGDGLFRIDSLAPGKYRLWISATGMAGELLEINIPSSGEIQVTLWPAGTLQVIPATDTAAREMILLGPDGGPVPLDPLATKPGIPLTPGEAVTIPALKPGAYIIRPMPAGVSRDIPVMIEANAVTTVELP